MKHGVFGNQLGRPKKEAEALYRGLVCGVLSAGRIETTQAKAKAIRSLVEKLVNLSRIDSVNNRRLAVKVLGSNKLLEHLFERIGPAFKEVNSGFTRIINLGQRLSDSSNMVLLELTKLPIVKSEIIKVAEPELNNNAVEVGKDKNSKAINTKKEKVKKTVKTDKSSKK